MAQPIHNNVVTVTNGLLYQVADLEVAKTVNNATPNEGNAIIYTITVTNNGPDNANGGRVTAGQQVLYTFQEGSGTTVGDVSGVGTPLDLNVGNAAAVSWVPGGLAVNAPTLIASTGAATKVIDAAQATDELTIEAWIKPANTTQDGPARIVTLSAGSYQRNFTLGQGLWGSQPSDLYDVRLRTTATDSNGRPSLTTPAGSLTTQLTHVVYTRDALGVARIYIDGIERASGTVGGNFANWDESYRLALANELTEGRPWLGEFYLVAIYNRALSQAEVNQNFLAGGDATGVQLTDVLPTGVTFGGYIATQGTYTTTTGLWTVGDIGSGASATLTITATVDSGTCGMTITNIANGLTADQPDPNPDNNEASADIDVLCTGADLEVDKTVNDATPNAGDAIIYAITVTNNGPEDATGVQLTDTLPAGVTYVSPSSASLGSYDDSTGVWDVGPITAGTGATLTITATVDSGTSGTTITNIASILTADQPDPNPNNNEDSADININPTSAIYSLYLPIIFQNYCRPLTDTFTSPTSGWPEVDNAALKTEYTGGEYRMLAKDPSLVHYAYQFADYFTDYEIEVDARWASSTSTGEGYGIVFGLASDGSHYYLYQVNADRQEYRLLRYSNGSWYLLTNSGTNDGWVYTNTINSSLNSNRLKVTRSGSQIILYVNNVYLETVVNHVITSGRVGLSVLTYYNDPLYGTRDADVRFDNYVLNLCIGTSSVGAESNPPISIPSIGASPRPD